MTQPALIATLETARHGSVELLDAVDAAWDVLTDEEFEAAMAKRAPSDKAEGTTVRHEGTLRAKLRPLNDVPEKFVSMAKRALNRRVKLADHRSPTTRLRVCRGNEQYHGNPLHEQEL